MATLQEGTNSGTPGTEYNIPFAYLRAFIVVLVILHHAACAYLPWIVPESPASSFVGHMQSVHAISPVNDPHRSVILLILVSFNDKFFMSLMFFLSGLFVWKSLQRKGGRSFLKDRALRLVIPFLVMAGLGPLTYYTTYLHVGGTGGFWNQWTSLKDWPDGPAWFISVLLAFDIVIVLLPISAVRVLSPLRDRASRFFGRPALLFVFLIVVSAAAYLPMTALFDPLWDWWTWGPLKVQTSRIFLYLVYFATGTVLGGIGVDRTCLTPDSPLAQRWIVWALAALFIFLGTFLIPPRASQALKGIAYTVSCAASCLAFLAVFLRFARRRRPRFDSLSANSYGMFVIHYAVVAWLLYAALAVELPALAKGSLVFVCATSICWIIVGIFRRVPVIARVI